MKYIFLFISSLFIYSTSLAQDCKCGKELDFVINYYEANLPGFKDNVNDANRNWYENFKTDLRKSAKEVCGNKQKCFRLLITYVEFFKDNHSSISNNGSTTEDEEASDSPEFIDLDKIKVKIRPLNNIENTYQTKDSAFTVVIVKSKNKFRDYAAVISESRLPDLKRGQVKFELKATGNNKFDMFLYTRNNSIQFHKGIELKDGVLASSCFNVQLKERNAYSIDTPHDWVFKQLDENTNYIYVPTFGGMWKAKLDSLYATCDASIRSGENLIIDVRNNGGGSDVCAEPLLKYMYTKPFRTDSVELYVTEENIRKWMQWYYKVKSDTINYSSEYANEVLDEIDRMKEAPIGSFIIRSTGDLMQLDSVPVYPKKVAVLFNKYSASSCEELVFWAKQSDKTILMGENSGGYVGYGEISEVETPNFSFTLGCTMTRSPHRIQFEATGISPDYYLNNNSDWVEQAMKIMAKSK